MAASRPPQVAKGIGRPRQEVQLMRKIVYSVAMSLDGYLAGPNDEADWIVMDPEIITRVETRWNQYWTA